MIKNIIIGAGVVIALIVGVVAYNKTPKMIVGSAGSVGPQGERGLTGPVGPQGPQGPRGASAAPTLGALSGPDISSPYFSYGGVRHWGNQTTLIQASTTLCSLQAPAGTSTLKHSAIRIDSASTSAVYIEMGKSSSPAATTTRLGDVYVLAANGKLTLVGTTTSTQTLAQDYVFAPNTYFVIKAGFATAAGPGTAPVGICNATWVEL